MFGSGDFVRLAESYAKIIVAEQNLADSDRSLKQVDGCYYTYFVRGITLVLAKDYQCGAEEARQTGVTNLAWKYGGTTQSDEVAAKAIGRVFSATNAAAGEFEQRSLNVPLTVW